MDWTTTLDSWAFQKGLELRCDEPMSRHTSFRTGGPARRMALPKTAQEAAEVLTLAAEMGISPIVLGNGTNVLAPDEGLETLVVCLTAMKEIAAEGNTLTAQAGVSLARLAETACQMGLTGLEFAHGIPGSLGGGVYMNGGAYGGEMRQVVQCVTAWFPGEGMKNMNAEALDMSYRHSFFMDHPEVVILSATVALTPGDQNAIRETMRELMQRRKTSQPLEYPSAGSTFKRPAGHFAGGLIQQCGLKGLTIGGAQVSEKHAGFVINIGGATSNDIKALMKEVQRIVLEQTGVTLEPEVRLL